MSLFGSDDLIYKDGHGITHVFSATTDGYNSLLDKAKNDLASGRHGSFENNTLDRMLNTYGASSVDDLRHKRKI